MIQKLNDQISVLGLFQAGQLKPLRFIWQKRSFKISCITTCYQIKDGGVTRQVFAVESLGNIYKLIYSPLDSTWVLDEVYLEG